MTLLDPAIFSPLTLPHLSLTLPFNVVIQVCGGKCPVVFLGSGYAQLGISDMSRNL
jgi:hypothetical protein